MNNKIQIILATTLFFIASTSLADIVVIVHPSTKIDESTQKDISRIFLGQSKALKYGLSITPINQAESSPIRNTFSRKLCNKTPSQYKAHWAQLSFSGKGVPPRELPNDEAVKNMVASTAGVIGYIDEKSLDDSVKVLFRLP